MQLINRGATMSQKKNEMLTEYDFSKGERGKYATRYAEGTNVVLLYTLCEQDGEKHD